MREALFVIRGAWRRRGASSAPASSIYDHVAPGEAMSKSSLLLSPSELLPKSASRYVPLEDPIRSKKSASSNTTRKKLLSVIALDTAPWVAAAYTNLQVDIDRIRADNLLRQDVQRKSGLIIWAGRARPNGHNMTMELAKRCLHTAARSVPR